MSEAQITNIVNHLLDIKSKLGELETKVKEIENSRSGYKNWIQWGAMLLIALVQIYLVIKGQERI